MGSLNKDELPRFTSTFRSTLQRSKHAPIQLTFDENWDGRVRDENWTAFWTTVAEFMDQYSTLTFEDTETIEWPEGTSVQAPSATPQLHTLKLINSPGRFFTAIPLASLTHLTFFYPAEYLEGLTTADVLNVLRSAPLLQVLRLNLDEEGVEAAAQQPAPFSLPHLHTFEVQDTYNAFYEQYLFRLLSAPSLECLDIAVAWVEVAPSSNQLSLYDFIARAPNLKEFRICFRKPSYLGHDLDTEEPYYFRSVKTSKWRDWNGQIFASANQATDLFDSREMCEVAMRKLQELEEPDEKYGQDYEKRRIFKEG
ncbi:hypothetical protein CC1G_08575 [Coprinopsis cinerea okayama7|uniref:F-box domain-containing protein n=1 Tax=Coprinopsis cinerea (strain Okayama-7 / 130 / ATCC MYA-4618 / FGSC 9003) TaxID=240176 RepID=A8NCT9_COPC7|nr:hypothetical protein CC1G_08575 [Coprinopsis cinerea okayama7\|eukprot:XP_001832625.1 hypothetical protein CC1G_08575 [Coprinopsis cinerea okayama7\